MIYLVTRLEWDGNTWQTHPCAASQDKVEAAQICEQLAAIRGHEWEVRAYEVSEIPEIYDCDVMKMPPDIKVIFRQATIDVRECPVRHKLWYVAKSGWL